MYWKVHSVVLTITLLAEDFTLELNEGRTFHLISSNIGYIYYAGKNIITTDTKVRDFSYWGHSHHTHTENFKMSYSIFASILKVLTKHKCHVPCSDQSKIMDLLGDVLY